MEIYTFLDYKTYLNGVLDSPGGVGGRGARGRLAKAIQCQSSYVAQVLKGSAHFSLEQGELINSFLGHEPEECDYFLLLINYSRAGSKNLKDRHLKNLKNMQKGQQDLYSRLKITNSLDEVDKTAYYSSWHFSAIHTLISIPEYAHAPEKIAARLNISPSMVQQALNFLVKTGVLILENDFYKIGKARMHLSADSPLVSKHHMNWRLEVMKSFYKTNKDNLHYSSVVSLSEADAAKIKNLLIASIEKAKGVIKESPEEKACGLLLDFFEL